MGVVEAGDRKKLFYLVQRIKMAVRESEGNVNTGEKEIRGRDQGRDQGEEQKGGGGGDMLIQTTNTTEGEDETARVGTVEDDEEEQQEQEKRRKAKLRAKRVVKEVRRVWGGTCKVVDEMGECAHWKAYEISPTSEYK